MRLSKWTKYLQCSIWVAFCAVWLVEGVERRRTQISEGERKMQRWADSVSYKCSWALGSCRGETLLTQKAWGQTGLSWHQISTETNVFKSTLGEQIPYIYSPWDWEVISKIQLSWTEIMSSPKYRLFTRNSDMLLPNAQRLAQLTKEWDL